MAWDTYDKGDYDVYFRRLRYDRELSPGALVPAAAKLGLVLQTLLVPLIIRPFGADPAMVGVLTLSAGASGTLMTPMAANFNIVPVALLGLKSDYAVIRAQVPVALALLAVHVLLMWAFIRFVR